MIDIKIDTSDAERYLIGLGREDQLPFATSKAINAILLLIQQAIRDNMQSNIKFTQLAFNMRAIKISKFSNKRDLNGEIMIDPVATNLVRLDLGLPHVPLNGKLYFPISNAVVFNGKPVKQNDPLFVGALNLKDAPGGGMKGDQRTFIPKTLPGQTPLILQRVANVGKGVKAPKGQHGRKGLNKTLGTRVLYKLIKRSATPKKFDFVAIANAVINQVGADEMNKAIQYALDTARKK